MKPTVFITRKLPDERVEPLREKFNIRMWDSEDEAVPVDLLKKEAAEVDALWTMLTDTINSEMMDNAPNLKIIANMAVGFNNIDVQAAKEKGIIVTNTPDVLTETTADLAFALLLSTARKMTSSEKELRGGGWHSWTPMGFTGMDVNGTTLGIIGMGRIGEAVARRAKGFNMRVIYHNRNRKENAEVRADFVANLDDLLQEADHVLILVPLTEETEGMIGERELALMKSTATLISASRGGIVDEVALYEALKNGTIWGAGLDVYKTEPVHVRHPLLTLPNVTAVPHIGSATVQTRHAMMKLNAQAIIDVLEDREPANRVG